MVILYIMVIETQYNNFEPSQSFCRAKWHGEVAVKILHVENPSEKEKTAFKYKVEYALLRTDIGGHVLMFVAHCNSCVLCQGSHRLSVNGIEARKPCIWARNICIS